MTEETSRQPDVTDQPGPAAATPAAPQMIAAQRALAEEREERQDRRDEETASAEQETGSRKKGGPAGRGYRQSRQHQPVGERRGHGRTIIAGSAIATLVLLSAGSALLLTRHAARRRPGPTPDAEVPVRDRAADWVASQVGRAGLVSCDQVMCRALQARGIPADDLLVLKPGGAGPLRSAVVVVTAAVRKMVGGRLLAADAPAAVASFGSGAGRISIQVIFPRGAAAYATALRKEIADRKAAGSSLLLLGSVTASTVARQQLQGGQVDSRLLLTLGELASQGPLTIVSFGDRAPGASPGIPFRSADLVVTGRQGRSCPGRSGAADV